MASASSSVRPPAVAGSFYPGSPEALRAAVEGLLAGASPPAGRPPKAVIAPHAGYVYSGPIAATAFAAMFAGVAGGAGSTGVGGRAGAHARVVKKIVLLGPAHRVWVRGLALPSAAAFATPLGEVPVDPEG